MQETFSPGWNNFAAEFARKENIAEKLRTKNITEN
jgi:hypothetical protein